MENIGPPRRDPSLWGVYGICLLLAPVGAACALTGALVAIALGFDGAGISIGALGAAAVLTVPAWALLFHLYLRGHWRLHTDG